LNDNVADEPEFVAWRERLDHLRLARRRMIEQGIASGEFVDVDPDLAQRAITWMILGNIADVSGRQVEDADGLAAELAQFALRGLLRDPRRLPQIVAEASR
jgi:hypothetical protein